MHPILFHLGTVAIRSYGAMILVGFVLGLWFGMAAARRLMAGRDPNAPGVITPRHVFDASRVGLFVGLLGTRVLYVVFNWQEFRGHPLDAFVLWKGGLTFIGAPIFGFAYGLWYSRRHRLPFARFADIAAPAFALGEAFGRVGCFLNGCCYGHACSLPWAVQFPDERHLGALTPPSHPVQLYEAAFNFLWFVVLARWLFRPHRDGEVVLGFFALYCVSRFIDEGFRIGATADLAFWGLAEGQVIILFALPIILLLMLRLRRRPLAPAPPAEPPEADALEPLPTG